MTKTIKKYENVKGFIKVKRTTTTTLVYTIAVSSISSYREDTVSATPAIVLTYQGIGGYIQLRVAGTEEYIDNLINEALR